MGQRIVLGIFFLSGISGLVYQVIWIRLFGNVFGNTVYSVAAVTAVFMFGLGVGSYLIGRWGDRSFFKNPVNPLRLYGYAELLIGLWCLLVAFVLPKLTAFSAWGSAYVVGENGWYELSAGSYLFRYVVAILLVAPPTLLMGGTLTLLIRYSVARRVRMAGWKIGLLYGLNTLGAASGCFLTDLALVPALGIFSTQIFAVALNWAAGGIALLIAKWEASRPAKSEPDTDEVNEMPKSAILPAPVRHTMQRTALALFLSGFAAMGLEIVWFRLLVSILGGYRAVFSIVLTVVLLGIWLGAVLGGAFNRRWGRPALLYVITQSVFAASTIILLMMYDSAFIRVHAASVQASYLQASDLGRWMMDLWANLRVALLLVGLPAVCMGFTFPLSNALVQRSETTVGGRAGALYLSNTAGNVSGSVFAGFVFLPLFGAQVCFSLFVACAALSVLPLYPIVVAGEPDTVTKPRARKAVFMLSLLGALATLGAFSLLSADHLLDRIFAFSRSAKGGKILGFHEGINETLLVTEEAGRGRRLHTNGHLMSSTLPFTQRYMRSAAHIPLLQMESPRRVLDICFGVGNTLHAVSLHPTVERLETVDLSRAILEHAGYFKHSNRDVLSDPRVRVFVNDGRHHLLMQEPESYDLITLEPPPIAFAGTSALYTREFYLLAKSRLRPGGYLSQWLPTHQLPADAALALVRAFVDVFPESVLINGSYRNMVLLGYNGAAIEIDIDRVARHLSQRPQVQTDLKHIRMGTLTELAGSFAASGETMRRVSRQVNALVDDRPVNEYAVRSNLQINVQPKELFDVSDAAQWCPQCFSDRQAAGDLADLPVYLQIMQEVYSSAAFLVFAPPGTGWRAPDANIDRQSEERRRAIERSPYLQVVLPHH